jgi:hypothetical protein
MTSVCAFLGLPGGTWQIVHLPGSLVPGVVGFEGFAFAVGPPIHNTRANKVPAETTSIEPLIRRNNCAPLETISNFFIEALC